MIRNSLFAGAALLCLAASPVLAGESTPAEKEATRQLNMQAARDAAPAPQQQIAAADSTAPFASAQSLSELSNPPSKIATANVLDSTGKTVGAVQKVEVSSEGKPTRLSVALIGAKERIVVLDASAVSYDAHKNEITAKGAIPSAG